MIPSRPFDLVVLVPDQDYYQALNALLSHRQTPLLIRPIQYDIHVHTGRDPGCFWKAPEILQTFQKRADYALVLFDHEGSGQEMRSDREVANNLIERLKASGWEDRADVIVLQPEIETWVWSDSPHVASALGWEGQAPALRDWLSERGLWGNEQAKPAKPKEALQKALRKVNRPRSSTIYRQIAERVSLDRCQDPGFLRLRMLLQSWFPHPTC